jgi:3-methyladenine DNA glycosylase/8-oxoguanine DNA glycosylase
MRIELAARPPFKWESVIRSHGWYLLAPLVYDPESRVLVKPEQLPNGRIVLMTMRPLSSGVSVEVRGRVNPRERREIGERVAWMFSLEQDLTAFYRAARREAMLAHVRREAHGRFLRSTTVWEDVVKVMMTTNIQWSGTKRLVRSLVDAFGESYEGRDGQPEMPLKAFPAPGRIAQTRESRLRALGLGYRSPYLLELARGTASGKYEMEALKDPRLPTSEVRQALLALPGIGPYAAATMLMILGRHEYIGVDTEAHNNISKGFYGGRPVTEKEIQGQFEDWGAHKALAYWFWDWERQFEAAESR